MFDEGIEFFISMYFFIGDIGLLCCIITPYIFWISHGGNRDSFFWEKDQQVWEWQQNNDDWEILSLLGQKIFENCSFEEDILQRYEEVELVRLMQRKDYYQEVIVILDWTWLQEHDRKEQYYQNVVFLFIYRNLGYVRCSMG